MLIRGLEVVKAVKEEKINPIKEKQLENEEQIKKEKLIEEDKNYKQYNSGCPLPWSISTNSVNSVGFILSSSSTTLFFNK
jgi:hypothetical protein